MPTTTITTVFKKYSDADLHSKAMNILESLQNNAYFPNPPALPQVQAGIENFRLALAKAMTGDKTEKAEKNKSRLLLLELLRKLGDYVTLTADADKTMLVSSGFDLKKTATPRPPIDAPQDPFVDQGINSGEITLKIKADRRANGYSHEYTADPLTPGSVWMQVHTTRSKHVFKDLEPGKKYWFRIAMIAPRDQKAYSTEVARIAA